MEALTIPEQYQNISAAQYRIGRRDPSSDPFGATFSPKGEKETYSGIMFRFRL